MNKPLTVIINETRQAIYDIITNTSIHPIIIRDVILKDIYSELDRYTEEIIRKEKELYYKEFENKESTDK